MTELDYLVSIDSILADIVDYLAIFIDEQVPILFLLILCILGVKTLFYVMR